MDNQKEVEQIIAWIERNFRNGGFDIVDEYLLKTQPNTLSPVEVIAILSMSYHGKDKLLYRDSFLQKAEIFLKEKLGKERAEKLLQRRR